jgi:hypothetical protein
MGDSMPISEKDTYVFNHLKDLVAEAKKNSKAKNAYVPFSELMEKCGWLERIVRDSLTNLERARRVKKDKTGSHWTIA